MQENAPTPQDATATPFSGFRVELVPFSPQWHSKYETEECMLLRVLNGYSHHMEHIGSTAVDGARAKPIIDIAVRLTSVGLVPQLVKPLSGLGYDYLEEFGLPGRHFFVKGKPREFNLHIVDSTSEHWEKWLTFRDILRTTPAILAKYVRLKDELAGKYASQREKYTQAKTTFILAVLAAQPV
jgi:GrpB-like predicted nucleotidyltransferase (UPF0157 family)